MSRDQSDADAFLQHACHREPYVDPYLRFSSAVYADFFAQMYERRVVCVQAEDYSLQPVGVFCAAKKSGLLRLICDTRGANPFLFDPPATTLPSAAAFANMEAPGGRVAVAAGDTENAFYRLKLPDRLCNYFPLPAMDARQASVAR